MQTQTCSKCGRRKPIRTFAFRNKAEGKRQKRCADCQRRYAKRHYARNKKEYKKRAVEFKQKRRKQLRELVNTTKNAPCLDCGIQYPPYVMDFDHRRDKVVEIANMVRMAVSEETIKEEILKCDIVCSNCHRQRTHNRMPL